MVDLSIEKLIVAIENGKVRGFDEIKEINGESYFFQYAIKKQDEKYNTYFFKIPENKMEVFEIMQLKKLVRFPI
ncbi:hypothetical protein [Escherichia coli]|uniref:hypothetical protein n=1 Tax=Escherichia coli TaxID=562 RepID=UPI002001B1CE|nr:hypothetical protein [Escherichia coli]